MALSDQDVDRIAQRVFSLPPADWAQQLIPAGARSGSLLQDYLTVKMVDQAWWQEVIRAMDEAAFNLIKEKYQPKVTTQGG